MAVALSLIFALSVGFGLFCYSFSFEFLILDFNFRASVVGRFWGGGRGRRYLCWMGSKGLCDKKTLRVGWQRTVYGVFILL
jgi:hypothetical protein